MHQVLNLSIGVFDGSLFDLITIAVGLNMNILIVSYIYPNKNDLRLGLFVHEQAKELVRQGHKVFVLTSSPDADEKEVFENVIVYRIRTPIFLKGIFFNFKAFCKIIKLRDKIDIIHLHFVGINSIFSWIASKLIGIPLVATVHGIDVFPRNFLHNILIKIYLLFPKRIMTVSNFIYGLAALNTNTKKLRIVNNGVDLRKLKVTKKKEALKKELGLENKKILLSVGCLANRKGIDIIIKALPDVIKSVPNLVYLIIGKGEEENNLKNLCQWNSLQISKAAWNKKLAIFLEPAWHHLTYLGFGLHKLEGKHQYNDYLENQLFSECQSLFLDGNSDSSWIFRQVAKNEYQTLAKVSVFDVSGLYYAFTTQEQENAALDYYSQELSKFRQIETRLDALAASATL